MLSPGDSGAPIVLIIPGSGPTDQDGNSPLGVKSSPYRLLAEGLADKGVATVRIDKRGMFASSAAIADANDVTIEAYANDIHVWIDAIRRGTGRSCVWVLGHSEGGLVALKAAQQPDGICGLVLVATAGRPLGEILREQLKALSIGSLWDEADSVISSLEAGKRVDASSLGSPLQRLFSPSVQGFLISELDLDPAKLAESYAGPVLIVQGDRDLQVGRADVERLSQFNPTAKVVVLSGVNHVLKTVSSTTREANLATYADPDLPLGAGIVEAVADFVTARRAADRQATDLSGSGLT
jgi:hypothetical protein